MNCSAAAFIRFWSSILKVVFDKVVLMLSPIKKPFVGLPHVLLYSPIGGPSLFLEVSRVFEDYIVMLKFSAPLKISVNIDSIRS